ncbi:MAG: lamin tail domain-containing protein [Deltaproteobacteria bacterium]|nr:lamin tail domain-containing protein [Deltaproteobacteria bacterium]
MKLGACSAILFALLFACAERRETPAGKSRGEPCGVSSECSSGLLCLNGACADGCRSRDDCQGSPPGCAAWACVTGTCVSACDVTDAGPRPDATDFPDLGPNDAADATSTDRGTRPDAMADANVRPDASTVPDATAPRDAGPPPPCDPTPRAPRAGDLVINEILADPAAGADGDANRDGARDSSDDEFIEIGNTSSTAIDLTGVVVADSSNVRHVFEARTVSCGKVVVVFGSGDPQGATWSDLWVAASSGGLSLNNTGDRVRLGSAVSSLEDLATVDYGASADSDQSLVRANELDVSSPFVQHNTISGSRFSPGSRADGLDF